MDYTKEHAKMILNSVYVARPIQPSFIMYDFNTAYNITKDGQSFLAELKRIIDKYNEEEEK